MNRPEQIASPDFSKLIQACANYMDEVMVAAKAGEEEVYKSDDHREWIFESAIEAVYGNEIFDEVINRLGEEV